MQMSRQQYEAKYGQSVKQRLAASNFMKMHTGPQSALMPPDLDNESQNSMQMTGRNSSFAQSLNGEIVAGHDKRMP